LLIFSNKRLRSYNHSSRITGNALRHRESVVRSEGNIDADYNGNTQEDIGTASDPGFESRDPLESLPPVYPVEV
jgi:hypothetical protein